MAKTKTPLADQPALTPKAVEPTLDQTSRPPQHNNSTFLSRWGGGRSQLLVFVMAFVAIGGYAVLHSYAASITNDLGLYKAVRNLGQKRPTKISTTVNLTYNESSLRSVNLGSTSLIGKNGANRTYGQLEVIRQVGDSLRKTTLPFDVRSKYGEEYYKLSNTDKYSDLFSPDSNQAKWLKDRQKTLTRTNNHWYSFYPADQYDDNDPDANGLGCIINTPLVPYGKQRTLLGKAYARYLPLKVTKSHDVYTVQVRGAKNLKNFLNNVTSQTYGQRLNKCFNDAFHVYLTDFLNTAAAHNSLTISVTAPGNVITKLAIDATNAKGTLKWASSFNYTTKPSISAPNVTAVDSGGGLARYLINPNIVSHTPLFSYNLPPGWAGDYCGNDKNSVSVELYDSQPNSNVAYCNGAPVAIIGASHFDFGGIDYGPPVLLGKYNSFVNFIDDSAGYDALSHPESDRDCDYNETKKTILIDGHRVARIEHVNTSPCYDIAADTKLIQYQYYHDTGDSFNSFYASYTQEPGQPDYTAAFDSLVKSSTFQW